MIGGAEKTQAMQGAVSGTGAGVKSPLLRSCRNSFIKISEVCRGNQVFLVFSGNIVFMF
jgi:hypothetical protein